MNARETVQQTPPVEGEIDLFELWQGLVQEKATIFWTVFFITLLGGLYAFFAPKMYEVKAGLLPPSQALINEASYANIVTLDSNTIFKKVLESLNPISLPEKLLKDSDIAKTFKDRTQNERLNILTKAISIEIPTASKIKPLMGESFLTKVSVLYETPEEALLIAESILAMITQEVKTEIKEDLVSRLKLQLTNNQRSTDFEVNKAKQEIYAEIERLQSADQEKKEGILEQIKVVKNKAEADRLFKIQRLESDYILAKKLQIKTPTFPVDFKKESSLRNSIDLVNSTPSNYWNGTVVLEAELNSLKKRTNNAPYISELSNLNQQLEALEVNTKIEQLKTRTNFISFSNELRALSYKKGQLIKALKTIETAEFPVYKIALTPVEPTNAVKPKKVLILAVSIVLGLILGVFIALIRRSVKNRKAL
ncbi:MAG: Wzz/FepE/Etk N-terminal domain-containing protein [Thiomicrorhabdus sp.]|nr:Wzz/FepE/Etk N-terminal domain-containing protein [Thiomicrorhabdus sp.]